MSLVKQFLRYWSSTDITPDNAFLFEENLIGVRAIAEDASILDGVSRHTTRAEFAALHRKLLNKK